MKSLFSDYDHVSSRRAVCDLVGSCLLLALLVGSPAAAQWVAEGPGPSTNGQVEGLVDSEVVGAINSVAAHPSNADILYAGGANGGIWTTANATAASPAWLPQTLSQPSLSIGAIEFDPTDMTNQTLLAGLGRYSSLGRIGGARAGILHTINGGATWTLLDDMAGRNVSAVAPRGSVMVAAVDSSDSGSTTCSEIGIWRSTDSGATWSQITNGVPRGVVHDLASDPTDPDVLYASVIFADQCDSDVNGIYKSTDQGVSWSKVSTPAMDALMTDGLGSNFGIAVGQSDNVFVAFVLSSSGRLAGLFHSGNGGGAWTAMDLPTTAETGGSVGAHPGRQGGLHLSIAADSTDADVVYVGGDRQPRGFKDLGSFPNAIGAVDFSGRLFRGDAGEPLGSQWMPLTHSGTASNSAPHADSRDMVVDALGNLVEVDDGGIYKRSLPRSTTGDWLSLNGTIQTTEQHSGAYDPVSDIIIGGAQDTGTSQQMTPSGARWLSLQTADGGDVAVDAISTPGMSARFSSFQGLQFFNRRVFDAANQQQSFTTPALTVVSGAAFAAQFITPVTINHVDGNRMVFGSLNSVYESLDQGDTLTEIGAGLVPLGFGRNPFAYGAADNADLLYVGACQSGCASDDNDGVFTRTVGGGPLNLSLVIGAGQLVQAVTLDPTQGSTAFAADFNNVHYTSNSGMTWDNVTGNLGGLETGTLRSLVYVSRAAEGDAVVVGADTGVYVALAPNFDNWTALSTGLPKVPVFELSYDITTDKLVATTVGRGSFSLQPTSDIPMFFDGFESGTTSAWFATVN